MNFKLAVSISEFVVVVQLELVKGINFGKKVGPHDKKCSFITLCMIIRKSRSEFTLNGIL